MEAIFNLDGKVLLTHSGKDQPFLTVTTFDIEKAGVYTLEGPNGSGKSMFIRFLTGTLPGAIEQNVAASLYINGKLAKIYNYRDAVKYGIISVFQDDDLISSMTVFENILLRHGTSPFGRAGHYLWSLVFDTVSSPLTTFAKICGPAMSAKLQRAIEHLEPQRIDWKDRDQLRKRATELLEEHGVTPKILDEMPARLSGGGRAAAKLICAQLHQNTKVLLLDEAFNGVEIGVWPRYVDGLKAWARQKGTVIVAVTHSSEELMHWNPLARFDIRDGVFVVEGQFLHGVKRQAVPPRQPSSPVFELAANFPDKHASLYTSLWELVGPGSEMIALVDKADQSPAVIEALYKFIPPGYTRKTLSLSKEELKSLDAVIGEIEKLTPKRDSIIVVAGSRTLRILCSIALEVTRHLNVRGIVVAPETFDDAVQAVLSHSVNMNVVSQGKEKEEIRLDTFFSPDAFIVPLDSLDRLSSEERKLSLIPCVRLGLLFDEPLFRVCQLELARAYLEGAATLKVFRQSVSVLNEMADLGPQSYGIGRVARFGEAHAAMIEFVTSGAVSGGRALILGMMLESVISRSSEICELLKQIAVTTDTTFPSQLREHANWYKIESFYAEKYSDFVEGERIVTNLAIRRVGQFSVQSFRESLGSSPGRQNKNLSRFANLQAEGALQKLSLHRLRIGIAELAIVFAGPSGNAATA